MVLCVQGAMMPSRQLAKMAVALQMCELLFKAGKCGVGKVGFYLPGLHSGFVPSRDMEGTAPSVVFYIYIYMCAPPVWCLQGG